MIDASHAIARKNLNNKYRIIQSISEQIAEGNENIKGVMIESHLNEGNQKIGDSLNYGQSITDACMGWEDTISCLNMLNQAVLAREVVSN